MLLEKRSPSILISMVEDNYEITQSIRGILATDPEFQFNSWYQSGEEAIEKITPDQEGILIMDLNLPGMHGTECIEIISEKFPELKIVVLTSHDDDDFVIRSIKAGARGYLLKDIKMDRLLSELRVIHLGGSSMSLPIAQKVIQLIRPPADTPDNNKSQKKIQGENEKTNFISKREDEVLSLISIGYTYADVADELDISPHTVKRHIENIYRKLNVNSRSQAILKRNRLTDKE